MKTAQIVLTRPCAESHLAPLSAIAPQLMLLVSCIGRKLVMGDRVDEEIEVVAATLGPTTCLAGFYSYGEIAPAGRSRDCRLHNQTMTVTRPSERA